MSVSHGVSTGSTVKEHEKSVGERLAHSNRDW